MTIPARHHHQAQLHADFLATAERNRVNGEIYVISYWKFLRGEIALPPARIYEISENLADALRRQCDAEHAAQNRAAPLLLSPIPHSPFPNSDFAAHNQTASAGVVTRDAPSGAASDEVHTLESREPAPSLT